jgi:hypothetical protein
LGLTRRPAPRALKAPRPAPPALLGVWLCLALSLCPGHAAAQADASPSPLPPTPPTTGSEAPAPSVQGPPTTASGAAAAPAPGTVRITADHGRLTDEGTLVEGSVRAETEELTVEASSAQLDRDQVNVTFVGEIVVGAKGLKTTATDLRVNIETGAWRAARARAELAPSFFAGGVAEPVYVSGRELTSVSSSGPLEALDGTATTCDRDHPHFELRSARVRVIPDRRVTISRPALYVLGARILRLPWDVTVPLDRKSRLSPEVGRNEIEGYYLKLGVPYTANDANSGVARLHLTQLRGVGLGVDHDLLAGPQRARLSLFYEPSEGALRASATHRWRVADDLDWELSSSYQRNSGYSGTGETLTADWSLRKDQGPGSSTLDVQESLSTTSATTSRRTAAAFTHQQRLGGEASLDIRTNYSGYRYSAASATKQLDASVEYRQRLGVGDLRLVANDRFSLSGSETSSSSLTRLPELTLSTDARRLGGGSGLEALGLRVAAEAGRYEQGSTGLRVGRAALRLDAGGKEYRLGDRTRVQIGARYYQAFYDEGSARYVLGLTTDLRQQLGRHLNVRMQYQDSRPSGYSPVSLDSWGSQRDMTLQMVHQQGEQARFEVSTGYDFISNAWRTASGRLELLTSGWSKLSLQASYNLATAQWRPLDARWVWVRPEELKLSLSSVYAMAASQLQQVGADLDWTLGHRTRLQMTTRYSGYTHRVDQLAMTVTRDLHCWQAAVSYDKLTSDFQVTLGLKAIPGLQANLGSGRGYASGAGAGSYF